MLLPFKIALRFLKSSKGQTILITFGIAIGVSVQLFIGLLIQGLQTSLVDKTVGSSSHITVSSVSEDKYITEYESLLAEIKETEGTTYVSASLDNTSVLVENQDNEDVITSEYVLIRGLSLEEANGIYKLSNSLVQGNMPIQNTNQVIIGKEFSELNDKSIGEEIKVFLPLLNKKKTLVVSGIFDLKVSSLNETWIITDLQSSQTIFETPGKITSIEIQVDDVFNSPNITVSIEEILGNNTNLIATDWQTQNESLLSGLNGQTISSLMIQIFVIISVVLSIASVLIISVIQKQKQIGILKAMGIKDSMASTIFLTQGFLLGLMGAILGILLGISLIVLFTTFALNPDGTPLIPMQLNPGFIVLSALIAIIASTLASLIPAAKSSKLDPIEVIRNG